MDITFKIGNSINPQTEFRRHTLVGLPFKGECHLDVDAKHLFDHVSILTPTPSDLLLFAAAVYGCDKAVQRKIFAEDQWTRSFKVEIPLLEPQKWSNAKREWEECVGFLTGDEWDFSFVQARQKPFLRRGNRIKRPKGMKQDAEVVSLLSGGLDSFAGAIHYLESQQDWPLVIASHYDGKVAGPKSDQTSLMELLHKIYPNRIQQVRLRVGVTTSADFDGEFETSFRSRSLAFLAIGTVVASTLKKRPEIHIPENGSIALNYPLNPSRRGSCSTRTVHPHFLALFEKALRKVGIDNSVVNPFSHLTKGEANALVSSTRAFRSGYALTNSCAKSGHTFSWENRSAKGCGRCVPCLFRRASLHAVGLDNEPYGNEVLTEYQSRRDLIDDFRSLTDLLACNPDRRTIMRGLMSNGSLPLDELGGYADVVTRMIGEVRDWIGAKGTKSLRKIAGVKQP